MRRPLFYPLLALILGILIGDATAFPFIFLAAAAIAVLLFLLWSVRSKWNTAAFALILAFTFIVGLTGISQHQSLIHDPGHIWHKAGAGKLTIEGTVIESEQIFPQNNVLVVQCLRIIKDQTATPVKGTIRLAVGAPSDFGYGDFIRFTTTVKKISGFHNPGGFNYERYLNRQGIFVSGYVTGQADIVLIRHQQANRFRQALEDYRLYLKRLIYANAPTPEREILEAMTIGNQKTIPPAILDHFAKTGTSHILSISGLHIGIVASTGFFLTLLLLKFSEYLMLRFNILKIASAAALIPVIIYALVAGLGTPVLRSMIMALAFLLAVMLGRARDLYNILFGAALVILSIAPEALFEISFQLSFSAVLALIYMVPKFSQPAFSFLAPLPRWLQSGFRRAYLFILVSVAATLGTLPIIVFYFNRISTVTLIANLICVPILGMIALIPALVAILTAVVSPVPAGWLIKAASLFTSIAVDMINRLASLPWSSISFVKPDLPEIVLFYILLFLLIDFLTPADRKNEKHFTSRHPVLIKTALLASLALLFADVAYLTVKDKFSADLKITAIDVGQGSSTLVEYPRGVTMLIDGGGFHDSLFDMGKSVIAPFLYYKRIRKIDIVVLTHPHPDHLQGLIYILNNFDVGEIWSTGLKADDDLYRLWEKTIHERKIKVRNISSQTEPVSISDARIDFLWPPSVSDDAGYDETNDASVVLQIHFGNNRFMITGDISSSVESLLIDSGKDLKSDLLFMPHHGSVHSSSRDFIRSISPRYAIVSAGRNNVFRHPHPAVLERYLSNGVEIFRTDQQGAITVQTDGNHIQIIPWLK